MVTQKERMLAGKLYTSSDELRAMNKRNRRLAQRFNATTVDEMDERKALLKELLGESGEHVYIEPPFYCDYGDHISVGNNFYANFDCIMLDVAPITIGDDVMFGPKVGLYTAGHPIDAEIRASGLEFGTPITIGNKVWIGGSTVINPGVSIGDNVVIGSGSVVTKDIPDNVIAVGNPCKVLREITEEDTAYWSELKAQYEEEMTH